MAITRLGLITLLCLLCTAGFAAAQEYNIEYPPVPGKPYVPSQSSDSADDSSSDASTTGRTNDVSPPVPGSSVTPTSDLPLNLQDIDRRIQESAQEIVDSYNAPEQTSGGFSRGVTVTTGSAPSGSSSAQPADSMGSIAMPPMPGQPVTTSGSVAAESQGSANVEMPPMPGTNPVSSSAKAQTSANVGENTEPVTQQKPSSARQFSDTAAKNHVQEKSVDATPIDVEVQKDSLGDVVRMFLPYVVVVFALCLFIVYSLRRGKKIG